MDRILRNAASRITISIYDRDGNLVDPDGQTVNVRVLNGAGAEHIAAGAATRVSAGVYAKDLTSAQTDKLDTYEAEWTGAIATQSVTLRSRFEVVGGFFFTVAEARTHDNAALASTTTYPLATVVEGRELVENELEVACGVAFVRRGARARLKANGSHELLLPHRYPRELYSCSIDGTALTASEISALVLRDEGAIWRESEWTRSDTNPYNVILHYTHGHDEPPGRMRRAALVLLRHRLVASSIDDRAISFTDELGTRSLPVAGRAGQPFGIPDVDSAVQDFNERLPAIG